MLVGEYIIGNPNLIRPPQKPFNEFYDSCVDNMRDPAIFVKFDSASAYPMYLLEYNWCYDHAEIGRKRNSEKVMIFNVTVIQNVLNGENGLSVNFGCYWSYISVTVSVALTEKGSVTRRK